MPKLGSLIPAGKGLVITTPVTITAAEVAAAWIAPSEAWPDGHGWLKLYEPTETETLLAVGIRNTIGWDGPTTLDTYYAPADAVDSDDPDAGSFGPDLTLPASPDGTSSVIDLWAWVMFVEAAGSTPTPSVPALKLGGAVFGLFYGGAGAPANGEAASSFLVAGTA